MSIFLLKCLNVFGKKHAVVLIVIVATLFIFTIVVSANVGFDVGFRKGYLQALTEVSDETGMVFECDELEDGSYEVKAWIETETD